MKALVQVKKEGKWFVATDLVTCVADQGKTRAEALKNLETALHEHYKALHDVAKRKQAFVMQVTG